MIRFKKQPTQLSVKQFGGAIEGSDEKAKNVDKNGPLLPKSIRCIISGPSACGKTNLLLSLIADPNGVKFENVYIYSKTLEQEKYQTLMQILSYTPEIKLITKTSSEGVVPVRELLPNSIIIFDDLIVEQQDAMREYFAMARHRGCDCFYLAQSFARVPKALIRDNANLICVFKSDLGALKHLYHAYVNTDMSFDEFRQLCSECWKLKYGFLVIATDYGLESGRYRKGFDHFLQLHPRSSSSD